MTMGAPADKTAGRPYRHPNHSFHNKATSKKTIYGKYQ